ncbi:hypothetical protein [Ranid herpesvirus 3]|uniref:Probable DNA packing protein C-terminal domain-containing protein n=1 Tax=Ranid herpesvirus 3 TaxID=1987509 RepID=A0A1X9T5E8_9VIRU|nr:hypothetical protein [Ranid herpesvirus 3]ARR28926.1 hypothetical protein [Ranid herpesvirus 3]
MAITGTKQIHTTSPVDSNVWIARLQELNDPDNDKIVVHTINHQFKCERHAEDPGVSCPCLDIYVPDHMTVDEALKSILNVIQPGSFDSELTGCVSALSTGVLARQPFPKPVINMFQCNEMKSLSDTDVELFIIAVDPTFASGSKSSIACVSLIKTFDSKLVVSMLVSAYIPAIL